MVWGDSYFFKFFCIEGFLRVFRSGGLIGVFYSFCFLGFVSGKRGVTRFRLFEVGKRFGCVFLGE